MEVTSDRVEPDGNPRLTQERGTGKPYGLAQTAAPTGRRFVALRLGYARGMSSVMLLVPRRAQLNEPEARELIKRLEALASERGAANAISRIQHALSDDREQTLTPLEATAIHHAVSAWLAEQPELEPSVRDRLEKLGRATSTT
jgi:hypothetical protein